MFCGIGDLCASGVDEFLRVLKIRHLQVGILAASRTLVLQRNAVQSIRNYLFVNDIYEANETLMNNEQNCLV